MIALANDPPMRTHADRPTRVVELKLAEDARWDAYVERHPAAEVYHHSGWLRSLSIESNQPVVALASETDGGELRGVLPLMRTRGLRFASAGGALGSRLSSLPRTPVAGPLVDDDAALADLVSAAHARTRPGERLQLKTTRPIDDLLPEPMAVTRWRPTYVVDLPDHQDDLRFGTSRNHGTVMRSIRKAERLGVSVRIADEEGDLRTWYRLYLDLCRHRAQPPRPYRFFQSLWTLMRPRGLMRLLLADAPGAGARRQIIAGNVLLTLGDTVSYAFNGRLASALSSRPNELLHWHAMRDAIEAGHRRYDLGEVAEDNAGLTRFKEKWGARAEFTYRYHAPPLSTDQAGYGSIERASALSRLVSGAWRHVPLPITRLAGEAIHRLL